MMRDFAFFAYGESFAAFFIAYLAMLVAWAALSYYLNKALKRLSANQRS